MQSQDSERKPRVYSTCPTRNGSDWSEYARQVAEVSRWSDDHGCEGMLIYADNRQVDPWLLSQIVVENTRRLSPLPAVQPVYMHPFTVAGRLAAIGHMFGRRLRLNMVAGGFRNDLIALGDPTEHDRRYDRLTEYVRIVLGLLRGDAPVTLDGEFYQVRNLSLPDPLPEELVPEIFLSGSSEAGRAAARALDAVQIRYPEPPDRQESIPAGFGGSMGVRMGIIAREDPEEAWRIAYERFPPDREGQLAHQLAMKVSDSVWHRKLSEMAREAADNGPYWLVPFENYKTMCPYLVGGYETVAAELSRYLALGYDTYILDIPRTEGDLRHTRMVFDRAATGVAA